MGVVCTNPSDKTLDARRRRAEKILAQRAAYTVPKTGETWADISCYEGCPGWAVFDTDRGFGIQSCDDCNAIAKRHKLPLLTDQEVKELPAARRALKRQIRDYGSAYRAPEETPDETEPEQNPKLKTPSGQYKPVWQFLLERIRQRRPDPVDVLARIAGEEIQGVVTAVDPDHKRVTVEEWSGRKRTFKHVPIVDLWIDGTKGWGTLEPDTSPGPYAEHVGGPLGAAAYLRDMGHAEGNPRSLLTGPKWDAAREKLRGAASGARKNPRRRCTIDHEALKKDDAAWAKLEYVGRQLSEDDDGNDYWLELRDCTCGSTLARPEDPALRKNPATPEERAAAEAKYEEFHRYPPVKIGTFHKTFSIPSKMYEAGKAIYVTYRSGKVDPSTLKKPRRPINYIHEHDVGVKVYLPVSSESRDVLGHTDTEEVPSEFQDVQALVMLGQSLGFAWQASGVDEPREAEGVDDPFPELYCTPDGKCLLVVQDKREVLAMIWGGALGVYARGIDG